MWQFARENPGLFIIGCIGLFICGASAIEAVANAIGRRGKE